MLGEGGGCDGGCWGVGGGVVLGGGQREEGATITSGYVAQSVLACEGSIMCDLNT